MTTVLYSVGKAGQPHSYNMWHLWSLFKTPSFEPLGTGFVCAALKLALRCQAGALLVVLSSLCYKVGLAVLVALVALSSLCCAGLVVSVVLAVLSSLCYAGIAALVVA